MPLACPQLLAFLIRHAGDDQALMSLAGRLDYNDFFSWVRQGRGGVDALQQSMARLST